MKYDRQICTGALTVDQMWAELRAVLGHFGSAGLTEAEILFAFAWGNKVYAGTDWVYIGLPLAEIEPHVRAEEEKGYGRLGRDDLFLRHADLPFEVHFCHERDLHIWLEERTRLVDTIVADWHAKGFVPRVWVKGEDQWIEQPLPDYSVAGGGAHRPAIQ